MRLCSGQEERLRRSGRGQAHGFGPGGADDAAGRRGRPGAQRALAEATSACGGRNDDGGATGRVAAPEGARRRLTCTPHSPDCCRQLSKGWGKNSSRIFLDKNRRHIGKSQSKRPPVRVVRSEASLVSREITQSLLVAGAGGASGPTPSSAPGTTMRSSRCPP
jgi:hypothetical protein